MIESPVKPRVDPKEYRKPMLVTEWKQFGWLSWGYREPLIHPICPRCGGHIEREYMKFCCQCGQRFKWAIPVRRKTE